MKKQSLFIISLLVIGLIGKGQITLENKYETKNIALWVTNYSNGETKFYSPVFDTNEFTIYNADHSVYKTISFPASEQYSHPRILFVSDKLFNLDDKTEFMVHYIEDFTHFIKIYNEEGQLLFEEDSLNMIRDPSNVDSEGFEAIFNTSNGTKMIYYDKTSKATKVYSLPGTYNDPLDGTTHIKNLKSGNLKSKSLKLSKSHPNPSKNYTKIDYKLPEEVNQGQLLLYTEQGKLIKTYTVDHTFDHLRISTSDLNSGTYYYKLKTDAGNSQGKKMIVIN